MYHKMLFFEVLVAQKFNMSHLWKKKKVCVGGLVEETPFLKRPWRDGSRLITLPALVEDPGLTPSTHIAAHNPLFQGI